MKNQNKAVGFNVNVRTIENEENSSSSEIMIESEVGGQSLVLTAMLEGVDPDKLPVVEFTRANAQQLREYNRSTKQDAKAGFQIKLNDVPAYGIFQFADGSFKQDNLFDILITSVGNARQSEGMQRAMIDRAQRYAHNVKCNLAAYKHFFGELTEEQTAWMNENSVSYEHEVAVAKERAKLANGGQNND